MALLPVLESESTSTLLAVDRALVERSAAQGRRTYLGISQAGEPCSRRVWSRFRWVALERADAVSIRRFEDGNTGELMMAERLRLVPGVVLEAQQQELVSPNGHVLGHVDGYIRGLREAPKTRHVWEHKQTDTKHYEKLLQLKMTHGEKGALSEWSPVYYVQAQLYMLLSGLERHYMTVATPGGRAYTSLRTEIDREFARAALARAEGLAVAPRPPAKLAAGDFACKFCPFAGACHGGELPERNCRTCMHSTPTPNGTWTCERYKVPLSAEDQRRGCADQRFIPDLVPGTQIDVAPDGSWVEYEMAGGARWKDEGK